PRSMATCSSRRVASVAVTVSAHHVFWNRSNDGSGRETAVHRASGPPAARRSDLRWASARPPNPESPMVTMSDVARAVGVTPVTVSNVVNGRKGVSPDVRRRVQAELERPGYRPNVSARNLRVGRTGVIGLAVPELDSTYFGQLGTLITAAAAAKGYRVVVEETKARASRELAAIQLSEALDYDGLILSAARLPDADEPLTQLRRIPTVLLGERDLPQELDHIELANIDGTREATELLIARGCRKLAFVGRAPRDDAVFGGRREGFYAALSVAGLEAVTSVPL